MKMFLRNNTGYLFIVLLFSLPLTQQLFHQGFFVKDDGEWMIIRSSAFHQALLDGQFPVRFLERLFYNYGYPVPTFLYPGYLYLVEPLYLLGFGFIDGIKIFYTATLIASGFFAYFWLAKLFNKWSALIGALVYLYTPYHLVDMYKRGSLGELLALTTVPFILWQLERKSLLFTSLGIALLLLSHNIMAVLFLPVIFIYSLIKYRNSDRFTNIKTTGIPFLFGLGLAAFFWLPALYELQYTIFSKISMFDWRDHFADYSMIGGLQLVLILSCVLLVIFHRKEILKRNLLLLFFSIIGLVSVFFSSPLSSFLWNILPVTFLQFPFRFLSLEIVAVSFLAAYLLYSIKNKLFKGVFSIIICIALGLNAFTYLTTIEYYNKGDSFYSTHFDSTTSGDEYTPVWVKEKPIAPPDIPFVVSKGQGTIRNFSSNNKVITFTAETKTDVVITINKIYWPGWTAKINNKDVTIFHNNPKGLISLTVPKGLHQVTITFSETPFRLFADSISVVSLLVLLAAPYIRKNKIGRKHSIIRKR